MKKKNLHRIQVPSRMIVTYLHAMLVTPRQYAVARTQNLEKTIQLVQKQYDKKIYNKNRTLGAHC